MAEAEELQAMLAGRYEVVRLLGQGGMGQVFEAIHVRLKRKVALKTLRTGRIEGDELRRRFVEEGRILARLSHPNIVGLYDADVLGDTMYLAMELVEGPSLEQRIRASGRMQSAETVRLALGVVDGLLYLHENGVLHRDLKPENILLLEGTSPKLADFGLARIVGAERLTAEGFMVGTPMYMAPELLGGREATVGTDLYALGVMLFRMVTGEFPIAAAARGLEAQAAKLALTPQRLAPRLRGAPTALAEVVVRCLSPQPADRFESVAQVERALARKPSGARPAARAAPAAVGTGISTRKRLWMPWVLASLAGGLAVWGLWPRSMAARPEFAPAAVSVTPLPGGCRIQWSSRAPYVSRLVADEQVHTAAGPTTQHDLLVKPVAWRAPGGARILFPDGSKGPELALAAKPWSVAPAVVRTGRDVRVELDLPETCALAGELRSDAGLAGTVDSAAAQRHELHFVLPHPDRVHRLTLRTADARFLPAELPPIAIAGPEIAGHVLYRELARLDPRSTARTLVEGSRPGERREALRERFESALGKLRLRELLNADSDGVRWTLGRQNVARPDLRNSLLRALEDTLFLDQSALYLGAELDTGVRGLLAKGWDCAVVAPPGGAACFERTMTPPTLLVTGDLSETMSATLGENATREWSEEVAIPETSAGRPLQLALRLQEARAEAMARVSFATPAGKPLLSLLFTYPSASRPREPVWLAHTIDAGALPAGPCRLRMLFTPLPGTLATRLKLLGVRLSVL